MKIGATNKREVEATPVTSNPFAAIAAAMVPVAHMADSTFGPYLPASFTRVRVPRLLLLAPFRYNAKRDVKLVACEARSS